MPIRKRITVYFTIMTLKYVSRTDLCAADLFFVTKPIDRKVHLLYN